jgi:pimeloyl-ACP methyl ester carboxylesterase
MKIARAVRAGTGILAAVAILAGVAACEDDGTDDPATEPVPQGADELAPADPDEDPATDPAEVPTPAFEDAPDCFGIEPVGSDQQDGAADDIVCGFVEVPLHHDQPDGTSLRIAVATVPGSASDTYERPLLVLGGGPGEVLIETFLTEPLVREQFDLGPDLIVIDQRGAGSSEPALDCPEVAAALAEQPGEGLTPERQFDDHVEDLLSCRDRLGDQGIDLGGFNHLANAADLDLIRQALGHDRIDVRGTSYGTQIALLAAQARPETIGRVILSSPVDPTRNWVELAPAGIQRAFDEVGAACEADVACAEEFGDLDALIAETVERLEDDPEEVTVELPGTDPVTLSYTPAQFLGGLALLFYLPDGAGAAPAFSAAAADGNLQPLADLSVALEQQLEGALSIGMQYSMLCTGEGALVTPEGLRATIGDGPIEEHWIPANLVAGDRMAEICAAWDVEVVYDPATIALDHDVPTLVVTGELDHVTPPDLGVSIDEQLVDSTLLEVPAAGHAPLEALGACGQRIAAAFLLDPAGPLDTTCATDRELSFVPGLGAGG